MNIVTGYRGEPHITSAQSRDENRGSFGVNSYILNVGQKLQAEISSANEIRIRDGALSHQGCVATIDAGAYDSLEIANGTQGMQRRDLIVARYTKDAETNVEDVSLVVIQGTAAASNPADPSYNTGNIHNGDSPVDMPLYRVNISGVNISSVTQIASNVRTQAELSNIGIIPTSGQNASCPNNTWTKVDSITLSAGEYLIAYGGSFESNSSGYRQFFYTTTNSEPTTVGRDGPNVAAINGIGTTLQTVKTVSFSGSTTLYFWARQTSGTTLTAYLAVYIMRIK